MTFTELVQTVLDHTNLTSPEARLRVGRSINRHYQRITARLNMDSARFVTRTVITTPNSPVVTFPQIEKIDRLLDASVLGSLRRLDEISLHSMRSIMPGTGGPTRYAVQSTDAHAVTVLLDAISEAIFLLQADGRMTLGDLMGEEEPRIPASYHDILSNFVIAEELLKKEKPALAAAFESRANEQLQHLQHEMADTSTRDTQQAMPMAGIVTVSGGGGLFPHHETHETGGSDALTSLSADILTSGLLSSARLDIDVLRHTGGYPGGVVNFLRADGTFALPPGGGAGGAHAVSHQPGGSDVLTALDAAILTTGLLADARLSVNVLKVAGGFPGNAFNFLRADGQFVAPGEQVTELSVSEGLSFGTEASLTLTATTHNLAMPGGAPIDHSIIKLDATAPWTLTGLVPPTIAGAYYIRFVINGSAHTISLAHNNASSTAGHRFATGVAADIELLSGAMASLVYDKGAAIWRVLASGGGGVRRIQTIDAIYSYDAGVEEVIPLGAALYNIPKTEIHYLASALSSLTRVRIIDANSIGVTLSTGSPTSIRTCVQLIEHA